MSETGNFNPEPGRSDELEPGVRRILAPNPSPMTFRGTNTYIVGTGAVAIIDPGPDSAPHLNAILKALGPGEHVSHIFVTHSHLDHSPLARPLAHATGAPVLAFGDSTTGRSDVMADLIAAGMSGGGEGTDHDFHPDELLEDGDLIEGQSWSLSALWTPGHFGNHMCFGFGDAVFTGDHVMGWASSMVSPPDGDLTAFMASCARLAARNDRIYYPAHGAPVTDPKERIEWLIAHRHHRESQILDALLGGPQTAASLTRMIYVDVAPVLLPAAERNVFAHLIDLYVKNYVIYKGSLTAATQFERCQTNRDY